MANKDLALMMSKYAMLPKGKTNPQKEKITLTKAELNKMLRSTAEKAAYDAIRLTEAIFLTVLCDKKQADEDFVVEVYQGTEKLSDGILQKYINYYDMAKVLKEEYNIDLEG